MFLHAAIITVATTLLIGCASTNPRYSTQSSESSPLTHGNVTLSLKKGVTSQVEVLEIFGAPNIASTDAAGNEVWTYQRNATVSNSSSTKGYATVILLGGSTQSSGIASSNRTMTLIIKFDTDSIVSDFKSRATSF